MLLIRQSVRGFCGVLYDVSLLTVGKSTRRPLLEQMLPISSTRGALTVNQQRQNSMEKEATELSQFIDELCNPNPLRKRTNAPFTQEQIRGMRVAADIYLDSLNLSEENPSEEVISQFSREVCKMSAFQLAHLLNAISQRRISHPFLPKHICTALNDCALPSTIYYICLIAYSLAKLSYLDKPLIHRIKEEFLLRAKTEFVSNQSLSFAVFAFACFRLSDRRLWRQIIELTEARKLNIQTLSQCVNSLAMVNADPKLVSSSVLEKAKTLNKDLLARHRLHFVHSLTILESLNAPLAERVLNKRFFGLVLNAHKKMGITEHLAQWDFICFRNIASAAQLELPKDKVPPINDALLDSGDPRSFSLVRDIKRGAFVEQKQSSLMERFELMFRLVAPLNSHSTSQEWHKTGAFLEGRCFVDTAEHQLIPLREANENSNVREVAVLLLMDRHFTQSIGPSAAEEEGPDRPTGINQMNIRHLKMVGIHPVVFTERHFRELGDDERSQIKFIRERILSLSEEFHYHNKWTKE